MTQIFSSAADTWLRFFFAGGAALISGSLVGAIGFARSDYYTGARLHPLPQPVPFSHRHHVSGLGLDCRYCHTTVAESARAGLPPTHTCMTCHSEIWTGAPMLAPVRHSLAENQSLTWHRVARLPDYVYFRHDIHIAKGVGCVTCHGRVDQMALTYQAKPLTMEFCLDCHRDPAPQLRPQERITDMTWKANDPRVLGAELIKQNGVRLGQITYCYVCHR
jgi:cytochrome c7-like protein